VTARSLLALFDSVYALALTAWVGSVFFFSFGLAPILFRKSGGESEGRLAKALLPRFYAWGMTWGAIALPSLMGAPLSFPEFRNPWVALQASAILAGILIMLYGGNTLTPALNAAHEAIPAAEERVDRLRRRAVWLNHAVLVLGAGLIVAFANRPAPRTSGIVEMSPRERARYHRAIGKVIEDLERKQGLRAPAASPGAAEASGEGEPLEVDPATIEELDAIFARKRARDAKASRIPPIPPARESHTSP
jgi:hypothetical protein